jgi:hypothetical protein
MRAGEVIAKLAENAYFMQVENRVTQVPPVRNRQQDNEATSRSADIGRNRTRAELPANSNRTRVTTGGPSHILIDACMNHLMMLIRRARVTSLEI